MLAVGCVHRLLLSVLREQVNVIAQAVAPMSAGRFAALIERAPPPVLRISFYPRDEGRAIANHPHSDIDLVTFLPQATAPGLQVTLDGAWHEAQIDAESVVILTGEMLELMGGPAAEVHRVVGDSERLSLSFFVNADQGEILSNGKLAGTMLEERLRMVGERHEPS
jgi:isopenicillin N synthase-like dioxygenase